jgi:hypothetical protein
MISLGLGYYYVMAHSPTIHPAYISVSVDYGNGEREDYRNIYCNNTPLAAIKTVANVEIGEEWETLYVHSVNSVTGYKGGEGWFWIYYVNGELKWDPIDSAILNENDLVEWRREYYG